MREAIAHFERALAIDEQYVLARAGIATACAWFSVRYAHMESQQTWAKRADDEARRALEQDPSLAEAHLARASAAGTAYGGYNWELVLDRTATALMLDPSLDLAHLARMRAYCHYGLFEDALREGQEAAALNPVHSVEHSRLEVVVLLFGGHYKQAIARAEALQARTDAPAVRHYLGWARYYAGDSNGARTMLASIRRGARPDTRAQATLASIEAATGRREDARHRITAILRGRRHGSSRRLQPRRGVRPTRRHRAEPGVARAGSRHRVSVPSLVRGGSPPRTGARNTAFWPLAGSARGCAAERRSPGTLKWALTQHGVVPTVIAKRVRSYLALPRRDLSEELLRYHLSASASRRRPESVD